MILIIITRLGNNNKTKQVLSKPQNYYNTYSNYHTLQVPNPKKKLIKFGFIHLCVVKQIQDEWNTKRTRSTEMQKLHYQSYERVKKSKMEKAGFTQSTREGKTYQTSKTIHKEVTVKPLC